MAKPLILFILYFDREVPVLSNEQRDRVIRARFAGGETISQLADSYHLSTQRIFQLVQQTT
ncbi:MAG: hypothetical protein IPO91_03090 [Chloroflexi bacterium]|nr:hypothetical protein [Chloroflexota bacterium]